MSARAGSIGSIALGVIVVASSLYSGNYYGAVSGVALIAGGIYGLVVKPESRSQQQSRLKDLEFATAGEGFPVPVIFGTQKVAGNFMHWNRANFRAVPIEEDAPQQGKGGATSEGVIVGHDYRLTFEYGLCMGPIDAVHQVWRVPGEKALLGSDPVPVEFGVDEYKEIASGEGSGMISPFTKEGSGGNSIMRVYRGSATQTRVNPGNSDPYFANGMNYRNLCWVLFMDFSIGRVPQPPTYQFVLRRLPHCIRDNGTTVSGIKTRGSDLQDHKAYNEANPAAILYEIATNKLWGRGLSSDIIHEQSFIDGSEFFASRGIGLSLTLTEDGKLADVLEAVRQHVKTIMVQDGDKIRLKVMLDNSQVHGAIQTISKETATSISVTRPSWAATTNELRVEFANRRRNYRPDEVHATDIANMALNGKLNPQRIHLPGFTDYNMARRQAFRILREISYPLATATVEINRFKSQIELGDCVRVVWDDFSEGEVTSYFIVTRIAESDSRNDDLRLSLIEDIDMAPVAARDLSPDYPATQPWEHIPDIDEDDLMLGDPGARQTGEINPVTAVEVPAILTAGNERQVWIIGEKPAPSIFGIETFWAPQGTETYKSLGVQQSFVITGELLSTIDCSLCGFDRSATGFQFSLTDSGREAELLSLANIVDTNEEHLEALYAANRSYMVIGEEVLMIGKVDSLGSNVFRARNFIRGLFGSRRHKHEPGDFVYYMDTLSAPFDTTPVTINNAVKWKAFPIGSGGSGPAFGELTAATANAGTDRITLATGKVADLGIKKWSTVRIDYTSAPTPLSSNDVYFVRDIAGDTFKLATQVNGAAINIVTNGAGVMLQTVTANPFGTFHWAEAYNGVYGAHSIRPLPPDYISHEFYSAGSRVRVRVRPRWFDQGAGLEPLLGTYDPVTNRMGGKVDDLISGLAGLSFNVEIFYVINTGILAGTVRSLDIFTPTVIFTPDEYVGRGSGYVTLEDIPPIFKPLPDIGFDPGDVTVFRLRIRGVHGGRYSRDYLTVHI